MKNAANVDQAHAFAKWLSRTRRFRALGDRLLGQPGRQGRDRQDGPGGCRLLQLGLQRRRTDETVVVAGQAAWFIAKRGEYADQFKGA